MTTITEYEIGRKARRDGESLQSNPYYWSWFRHCTWERGWFDEDRLRAARQTAKAQKTAAARSQQVGRNEAAHMPHSGR